MDRQLETIRTLFLYMTTSVRLLYAQKRKSLILPTIEERFMKMMELVEMVKLTFLITEKTVSPFIVN